MVERRANQTVRVVFNYQLKRRLRGSVMRKLSMKRFPRGQALTETTIALPLFLMGLFGIMWAVREGAMSERVQMGVRYGGVVTQLANPYADYSLYAMYATID